MEKNLLPRAEECFVCGTKNASGLKVEFYAQDNEVRGEFSPDAVKSGYKGIMHGGLICAVLDEVMGWAPAVAKKRMCMAAEITIRFVRPVPIGADLVAVGKFTQDRKRIWGAEGVLMDKANTVYSKATGKYVPIADDEARRVDGYLVYRDGRQSLFFK